MGIGGGLLSNSWEGLGFSRNTGWILEEGPFSNSRLGASRNTGLALEQGPLVTEDYVLEKEHRLAIG